MIAESIAEIALLSPAAAPRYAALTFPLYRELLASGDAVAVGVEIAGGPAGLALARKDGAVLSVAVARPHRRQGFGGALLAGIEEELRARGCAVASCTWMTGTPSTPALEALLRRRGWEEPVPRMLVCRANLALALAAPWIQNPPPLRDAVIRPWAEVPEIDRRQMAPEAGNDFEPANSLALYRGGRIAGCVVTHRIAKDLLRYSHFSVRPELAGSGVALALLAESIRRFPIRTNAAEEVGIFDVRMDNRRMLNVVRRRLQPYLVHVARTMGSRKVL